MFSSVLCKYFLWSNTGSKSRLNQIAIIAVIGFLLLTNKSFAADESITIKQDKIDNCSQANCLTLDFETAPLEQKQEQINFANITSLNVDKNIFYNPNMWLGLGVDPLNPLTSQRNFSLYLSNQTLPSMTLSSVVEHGAKKVNARAMLNQIDVWRTGPSLYWKLTDHTILSSSARWGNYNDGNKDFQSYSRLEQNFSSFSVAADLSSANYEQDLETSSGYFSPTNYLLYSAEAAWKQNFSDASACKLALRAGNQRLTDESSKVYSFGSFCDVAISSRANLNFNYSLANVQGEESDNYHDFTGTLKFTF